MSTRVERLLAGARGKRAGVRAGNEGAARADHRGDVAWRLDKWMATAYRNRKLAMARDESEYRAHVKEREHDPKHVSRQ